MRGFSALQAGLTLLPAAVATTVVAPLSGRMVAARGARRPLVLGGSAMVLVALTFSRLSPTTRCG